MLISVNRVTSYSGNLLYGTPRHIKFNRRVERQSERLDVNALLQGPSIA